MQKDIRDIVQALTQHLQSARRVNLGGGREYREPVGHITCRDGTKFSVQAGEMLYCSPRSNDGPWDSVEVMTLTDGVTPHYWDHDAGDNLAGYVPIEDVAKEIYDRGFLALTEEG